MEVGMRNLLAVLALVVFSFGLASCAKNQNPESQGTIALVNGTVKALRAEEVESVCATHFCEPNYIYHANFGGRRNDPPPAQPPAPAPAPEPTPEPNPPTPIDGGNSGPTIPETLDYSRVVMNLSNAWKVSKGSANIVVAVVDTGVQVDHRDLAHNIWQDANGNFGFDFANNRANAVDDNMHGTHVSGIIGAELNGIGIIGISPTVKIMPVKFLDANGSGSTDAAIKSINYAVNHGANVISNSWGGGGNSDLLNQAIQTAINRGIVVVAAAGNEATNIDNSPSYPASYPGVLAVASSDENDALSSFSNYGSRTVPVAAPGSNILSTVLEGRWGVLSGTSMATPQVSGAIALGMSVNPRLSVDTYKQLLCNTSKRILLSKVACGRIDVNAFVNAVARQ